jgi:hypothetical protein
MAARMGSFGNDEGGGFTLANDSLSWYLKQHVAYPSSHIFFGYLQRVRHHSGSDTTIRSGNMIWREP